MLKVEILIEESHGKWAEMRREVEGDRRKEGRMDVLQRKGVMKDAEYKRKK